MEKFKFTYTGSVKIVGEIARSLHKLQVIEEIEQRSQTSSFY